MTEAMAQESTDSLVQLSFLVQRVLGDASARYDLSVIQTRVLGVLRDRQPGMLELARLLDTDKSSASGLVNRAERRGLVRRRVPDEDRRSVLISITDEGRRVITAISEEVSAELQGLLAAMPARDRATLTRLNTHIVEQAKVTRRAETDNRGGEPQEI